MKINAQIVNTMLGYEDHGILTCMLSLKQDCTRQSFGGYVMDDIPLKNESDRQPSIMAGFWIKRILETVGVDKWEDLTGKYIRVDGEKNNIHGIGHIIEEKWFYPSKELKEFRRRRDESRTK